MCNLIISTRWQIDKKGIRVTDGLHSRVALSPGRVSPWQVVDAINKGGSLRLVGLEVGGQG